MASTTSSEQQAPTASPPRSIKGILVAVQPCTTQRGKDYETVAVDSGEEIVVASSWETVRVDVSYILIIIIKHAQVWDILHIRSNLHLNHTFKNTVILN